MGLLILIVPVIIVRLLFILLLLLLLFMLLLLLLPFLSPAYSGEVDNRSLLLLISVAGAVAFVVVYLISRQEVDGFLFVALADFVVCLVVDITVAVVFAAVAVAVADIHSRLLWR